MWRLDVSSEAELEIFEAALRYERERAGLGFRFEAQVNTVFASLLDYPFQFPEIEEGARRALVREDSLKQRFARIGYDCGHWARDPLALIANRGKLAPDETDFDTSELVRRRTRPRIALPHGIGAAGPRASVDT